MPLGCDGDAKLIDSSVQKSLWVHADVELVVPSCPIDFVQTISARTRPPGAKALRTNDGGLDAVRADVGKRREGHLDGDQRRHGDEDRTTVSEIRLHAAEEAVVIFGRHGALVVKRVVDNSLDQPESLCEVCHQRGERFALLRGVFHEDASFEESLMGPSKEEVVAAEDVFVELFAEAILFLPIARETVTLLAEHPERCNGVRGIGLRQ